MIILGIDPGTATTGYGVVRVKKQKKKKKDFQCLSYGCIETDCNDDFLKRLFFLSKELRKIVRKYNPDYVAVEKLFFFKNFKTAIKVSQAMGVIFLTLEKMKMPVVEFAPLEVKKVLTKNGRAKKKEVEIKVKKMLKLKEIRRDDSADALAVAICAAHKINQ